MITNLFHYLIIKEGQKFSNRRGPMIIGKFTSEKIHSILSPMIDKLYNCRDRDNYLIRKFKFGDFSKDYSTTLKVVLRFA